MLYARYKTTLRRVQSCPLNDTNQMKPVYNLSMVEEMEPVLESKPK